MEGEGMPGETQVIRIIFTLEESAREINSILHEASEPQAGRSKQPGNQALDVNRDSRCV